MSAEVIELPVGRMTAAEFRISRERLGLSIAWVASQLGVRDRSITRWETGENPVPDNAAELLREVHRDTNRYIMQRLAASSSSSAKRTLQLVTYRTDADFAAGAPEKWKRYSASWHRAMIGRLALLVSDRRTLISYA